MLYNSNVGVRCPIRVSSCNYEIFDLDESAVGKVYEECKMSVNRHIHQQVTRAYCESRRVEGLPTVRGERSDRGGLRTV